MKWLALAFASWQYWYQKLHHPQARFSVTGLTISYNCNTPAKCRGITELHDYCQEMERALTGEELPRASRVKQGNSNTLPTWERFPESGTIWYQNPEIVQERTFCVLVNKQNVITLYGDWSRAWTESRQAHADTTWTWSCVYTPETWKRERVWNWRGCPFSNADQGFRDQMHISNFQKSEDWMKC